jgi:exonuclease SbcC
MRILSIHLKNIKSHRDTRLDFSPGINVLSGPNGVGKSTVFEAIGYALFGVDAQKFVGNVDRFLSIGAKKGEIFVTFELDDGSRFQVSRTVGSAGRWLLYREVGGTFEVEEHKDGNETENRLKKLLGLENGRSLAEQFELVIGPFQNDFLGPFIIRQPARRRDEFDAILGIDAWRKTFSETAGLGKAIRGKVEVLQAEIGIRKEQVAVLPEKKKELQRLTKELEQAGRTRDAKIAGLKDLEILLNELDGREKAMTVLQNELDKLALRLRDGGQKIEIQEQRVREAEEARRVVESSRGARDAFEKAEACLKELREREKRRRELEKEIAGLDRRVSGLKGQCEAERRAVEMARKELDREQQRLEEAGKSLALDEELLVLAGRLPDIKKQLDRLRNRQGQLAGRLSGLEEGREKLAEGVCPFFQETCLNVAGQKARDVFSDRLTALEEEQALIAAGMEKLRVEEIAGERAEAKIREAEGQKRALEQQAAALQARQQDLEARERSRQDLLRQHQELSSVLEGRQQELNRFSGLEKAMEEAEKEKTANQAGRDAFFAHAQQAADLTLRQEILEKYCRLLKELQAEQVAKNEILLETAGSYDKDRHDEARRRKEILLGELGTLGQQINGLEKDRERLSSEIVRLEGVQREITAKEAAVARLAKKDKLVKFLRNKVFKNVSAHLSERFREEISQRADRIYRTISEADEELHWSDNYQVVLRDLHEGQVRERNDDQLSGGQMMSAVVALRLALLQTIGARIAFFDEPTSNLDVARRENLARAFRAIDVGREEVTEHWYDQLFLISHDISFTEITDQVISLGE